MKILYNTATGNSLYVAKKIKYAFENCELISIPKALREKSFEIEDEMIGFIYPIHYAGVPIVMYDFLSRVKINPDAYIFAIGVSGGGGANTSFYQINKLLGRNINNYLTVKYISNYTKMGTNPTEKRAKNTIANYDSKIEEFIQSISKREEKEAAFKYGIGCFEYKIFKDVLKNKDKNFNVNENCIGCNMCEKICPVNNITIESNKPKWNGKCVDCMACINICPKKAINIGKSTIKKNRYRNPYIEASELISD
ncbi:MAG: EFR1 family ferrodoxin [Clostridium neonatale]